jgi:hypothetical protein
MSASPIVSRKRRPAVPQSVIDHPTVDERELHGAGPELALPPHPIVLIRLDGFQEAGPQVSFGG